ncbi:MAG: DUF938 domain-containing protein [Spirulinaceae cyanobacterium SM2_1_0]|nr:DUF938 domain-containing protein [Spirulinaceae cyanobacterium SM2_1_0]
MSDPRRHAPATQRNREPILAVLQRVLPPTGTVLEVASGTGEHSIFFAPRLAPRRWLPSDFPAEQLASIRAWQAAAPAENLLPPLQLDASQATWPVETGAIATELATEPIRAIVNINMIHISPWTTGLGLLAAAGRILPTGGILYLYGPFQIDGQHTAPSNQAFDESLRSQDPAWGVRDLAAVTAAAAAAQLEFVETVAMPANNFSVIFRHS